MSNDSKIKGALVSLKKALAETDGSAVLVDREVLESLAQEISRQNSLTGLDKLNNQELICFVHNYKDDCYTMVSDIEGVLLERDLGVSDLMDIMNLGITWEFLREFTAKFFDAEVDKQTLLDFWESNDDDWWGVYNPGNFTVAILAQNPTMDELKQVRERLFGAIDWYEGEDCDYMYETLMRVQAMIKEKELFEESQAQRAALEKARSFMTEEEIENLRRAFQRLDESNDQDSGDSEH